MDVNSKPYIAIPCGRVRNKSGIVSYAIKEAYVQALLKMGALPVILPIGLPLTSLDELLVKFDGVLFSGGADIDPQRFNGEEHRRVYGVDVARDEFEIRFLDKLIEAQKPLLTICRGTQVLNVTLGGSLYTDIYDQMPNALKHDYFPGFSRDYIAHSVQFVGDSRLREILGGDEISTNSLHHQGIKDIGKGLTVTARAADGLVEAIEVDGHPFAIGVQWHPEWMQADARMMRLFGAFVEACCIA